MVRRCLAIMILVLIVFPMRDSLSNTRVLLSGTVLVVCRRCKMALLVVVLLLSRRNPSGTLVRWRMVRRIALFGMLLLRSTRLRRRLLFFLSSHRVTKISLLYRVLVIVGMVQFLRKLRRDGQVRDILILWLSKLLVVRILLTW